jgi:hypothetical protein
VDEDEEGSEPAWFFLSPGMVNSVQVQEKTETTKQNKDRKVKYGLAVKGGERSEGW